ncbi:MAG: secondary thiamine-phosphate synthase enzyme YjbQ [Thermoleophilia bacterium]
MPVKKKTTVGKTKAGADSGAGAGPARVVSTQLEFPMREELDIANITDGVAQAVRESGLTSGVATVFVPGATGAVTCLEYEPGVVADFKAVMERISPRDIPYDHNIYQADGNGHAHVRAGLLGPSLPVPFNDGELILGVWQQVVLVNCDNRRRTRRVIVQIIGA